MAKLFALSEITQSKKINVILIQIDEAHSSAWPVAIDTILGVDQPEPQKTFEDRVTRAHEFITKYNPPYEVYIDGWNNEFAELFRAWPDKYHCINKDFQVIAKAEYHKEEDAMEAKVIKDYTDLILELP